MDGAWLLLGFCLLFTGLTVAFLDRGDLLPAGIAAVHASFGIGGFWWNRTHPDRIDTRLPGFD